MIFIDLDRIGSVYKTVVLESLMTTLVVFIRLKFALVDSLIP